MKLKQLTYLLAAVVLSNSAVTATEYFVSLQGHDENSGTSRTEAFATIQRGVDALDPGDTLTILPGEYFGHVHRKELGSLEKETLIRAEIPGTVLLRGDRDVSGFEKVPDTRFVYSVSWPEKPQGVHEIDTLTNLITLTSIEELEIRPGAYFYDEASQRLYLSTSDFSPPEAHRYSVAMVPHHGFWLEHPRRVTMEGLAATGFRANVAQRGLPGLNSIWGFMLSSGFDSTLKNLTAYLNGGGIAGQSRGMKGDEYTGRGNLITQSTAYGNGSQFNIEGGDIVFYFPNADEIHDSSAYVGFPQGIRLYQRPGEFSLIRNCFARSHITQGIQNKGAGAHENTRVERSISLTTLSAMEVEHSIIGTTNWYHRDRETSIDNIYLSRGRIDPAVEFADPDNFDFRLQSTSQFRGTGPDGSDRGPFPYQPNIYYVSPDGDDSADGLSIGTAWKSAARAMTRLKAGDTLYLEAGEYEIGSTILENLGSNEALTSIRRRGMEPVTLRGTLTLNDVTNLSLERLQLSDPLTIQNSQDITVTQSTLSGLPANLRSTSTKGLRITHCQFENSTEAAIVLGAQAAESSAAPPHLQAEKAKPGLLSRIKGWFQKQPQVDPHTQSPKPAPTSAETAPSLVANHEGVFLQSNLFTETKTPAVVVANASEVLYSDYNLYASEQPWTVAGTPTPLEKLRPQFEVYSALVNPTAEDWPYQLAARGAFAMPGGPHAPFERELKISQPKVRSVSATTANIEWFASQPATCEVAWGPTEDCENLVSFDVDGYGSFSLTGLKPGTTYYFRILSVQVPEILSDQLAVAVPKNLKLETLQFTTAANDPAPRVWHVSTTGSNANSGSSPEQAWRTIGHTAQQVAPGDTVLIAGGIYSEQVIIPTTGDRDRPITFRAKEGEPVYLDGKQRSLTRAFLLRGKSHIYFDGFQARGFGMPGGGRWPLQLAGVFNLYAGDDIRITRCFNDGRGGGYSAPMVQAWDVRNLQIKNCVAVANAGAIRVRSCPDMVIENNVILRSNIQNLVLGNQPEEKITIRNNILGDNQPSKSHVQTFEIRSAHSLIEGNNCYYFRLPDEERKAFLFGDVGAELRRMGAAHFNREFGKSPSLVIDPIFAGLPRVPADRQSDYGGDAILNVENLSFEDFFPTEIEVRERGMGLEPEAFKKTP